MLLRKSQCGLGNVCRATYYRRNPFINITYTNQNYFTLEQDLLQIFLKRLFIAKLHDIKNVFEISKRKLPLLNTLTQQLSSITA